MSQRLQILVTRIDATPCLKTERLRPFVQVLKHVKHWYAHVLDVLVCAFEPALEVVAERLCGDAEHSYRWQRQYLYFCTSKASKVEVLAERLCGEYHSQHSSSGQVSEIKR